MSRFVFHSLIHLPVSLLLVITCSIGIVGTSKAQSPSNVLVDVTKTGHVVNPLLYGINTGRWDESLFPGRTSGMLLTCDRDAIAKVAASGVSLLKFPGGNDADTCIWNSADNNPTEMDTDEYIALRELAGRIPCNS